MESSLQGKREKEMMIQGSDVYKVQRDTHTERKSMHMDVSFDILFHLFKLKKALRNFRCMHRYIFVMLIIHKCICIELCTFAFQNGTSTP